MTKVFLPIAFLAEVKRLGIDMSKARVGDYIETAIGDFIVTRMELNRSENFKYSIWLEQCTDATGEPFTDGPTICIGA